MRRCRLLRWKRCRTEQDWVGVFWSWAALMLGRAACVGRADADVLRLGDPEGMGRLGRSGGRWPGVQPRTVRFSGGRGMDMGG